MSDPRTIEDRITHNSKSDRAAFPAPKINDGIGLTKREYAAIMLRVPDSGSVWLDKMIQDANVLTAHPLYKLATEKNMGAGEALLRSVEEVHAIRDKKRLGLPKQ